jgi:hypothetical protein
MRSQAPPQRRRAPMATPFPPACEHAMMPPKVMINFREHLR